MARLVDKKEMQVIYENCIRVFNQEISANEACKLLAGKTNSSESSLKMYFVIYACMRNGTCYKMGTSAAFTRFLIENIYKDNGQDAFFAALASAKQNAEYRISCGNEQPGIEATCRELIKEYELAITYEELNQYYGEKKPQEKKIKRKTPPKRTKPKKSDMHMTITYGGISFEVKGAPETVFSELKAFSKEVLPKTIGMLEKGIASAQNNNSKKEQKDIPRKGNVPRESKKPLTSIGKRIRKNHPEITSLSEKMDFKARMIPLMFLSDKANYQKVFSIHDIQMLMQDAIGEMPEKKQIEDVFSRRTDWFEKVNQNPRKYKLLDIAKDYARNILAE